MKKKSSNVDMEQEFNYLAQIKQVEPNTNLYSKTSNRIRRQNIIPLFWVKAIACLMVAYLSIIFYFTLSKNNSDSKYISVLIYKTNNTLYHE
jgi:hypothetical protein